MHRALVPYTLLAALSCGTKSPKEAPSNPTTEQSDKEEKAELAPKDAEVLAPVPPALGVSLLRVGPFESIDELCAHLKTSSGSSCDDIAEASAATPSTPFIAARQLLIGQAEGACALALQTEKGWYATWDDSMICSERGYIEVLSTKLSAQSSTVLAASYSIYWHSKNYDEDANFDLLLLCGLDADGLPRCTRFFYTRCEEGATISCVPGTSFDWNYEEEVLQFSVDEASAKSAKPSELPKWLGAHPLRF
ncbi:MAG: hypothetical protein JKY56_02445 [Kofleriaceae bacterium]|nr:hypothetical protein [Kofleriaceae bacterium]